MNKTLLLIVTGSGKEYWSEHERMELFKPEDNVDVGICFWGEKDYSDKFWKSAKYILKQKGNKFHLIRDFFKKYPATIDQYKRFLIMDDDIYMSKDNIMKFIETFDYFDFDLACPGFIMEPGDSKFRRKKGGIFRTLNTIDVGAFLMTSRAFKISLPIFNDSPYGHGWGIPEWWQQKYHHSDGRSIHGGRMGCIDASPAEHTRVQGSQKDALATEFESPYKERKFYVQKYMDGKLPGGTWWMAMRQYEVLTVEKLQNAIINLREKSNV